MNRRNFLPALSFLFLCGASIASAKAPKAPTDLKVTPIGANFFKLEWKDNSTDEAGWEIRLALKGTQPQRFLPLGTGSNMASTGTISQLIQTNELPGKELVFQVAAYNGVAPKEKFSKPTAIVTAKALSGIFDAPTKLKVKTIDDGQVRLKWKDHANSEVGYMLEYKKASKKKWKSLGDVVVGNPYKVTANELLPGTRYSFRVRAYKTYNGSPLKFTGYSNEATVKTKPFQAPSDLAVVAERDGAFSFKWKDLSSLEGGFEIQKKTGNGDFIPLENTFAANQTATGQVTGFDLDTIHQFRIRAYREVGTKKKKVYSGFSNIVTIKSTNGISSNLNPPIVVGSQFLYQIQASSGADPSSITVSGLPAGLVYNSTRRTITGKLTSAGTYNVSITAHYSDGSTSERTLVIKTIGKAPIVTQAFDAVSVSASTTKTISLTDKFSDPDTLSAARVATNLGTFDIILFPTATPRTVYNFLDYVDAGEYDNSFFHRSVLDFVVQGGGYKHTPAAGFTRVTTFAAVVNEPGLSNVRGTVAMAKLGGQPDSATSQFFVNLADNSANLDAQNEGFTVFGRVPAAGMAVLDAINDLPRGNYKIPIGSGEDSLQDVPVNDATASTVLNPAKLVKISSVGPAPILSYKVESAKPSVATASLVGTGIRITGVATGTTTIKVTATDLDGQSVTQNIAVTVP